MPNEKPPRKLLDQVSDAIRIKHYSPRTEKTYIEWIRQYILFHQKRHPTRVSAANFPRESLVAGKKS